MPLLLSEKVPAAHSEWAVAAAVGDLPESHSSQGGAPATASWLQETLSDHEQEWGHDAAWDNLGALQPKNPVHATQRTDAHNAT